MAFERFATRDESCGAFFNCKAPPVVSERHTIIEDCRGVQFLYSSPMAARKVIINRADHHYSYATKEEYHGSSWPKTTTTSRPPLPHPPRGYYPQVGNQIPNLPKRPVHGNGEVPQMGIKPITCDEAAKLFGGIVITEYRTKKQYRA